MTKGRILIVDDQEEILNSLGAILADEGHELLTARDGQEALHIVQSDSPDVVFLDIWIPGIDGMQTLKAIKKIDPECSVIMMSGHGTIETAVKAIKLGAADYLEKPLNLEDVLHLVNKSIAKRLLRSQREREKAFSAQSLIGVSAKAADLRKDLERSSREQNNILLLGAKGTGKEFLARIIHSLEGKPRNDLIKVRCTDITEANLEEILIGKDETADQRRVGKIQQALGGALFLVRIDRLKRELLDRVLELLKEQRAAAGSQGTGFRIISTSATDLQSLVQAGEFPRELGDMLSRKTVRVPSLQERPEDIPLLVEHFMLEAAEEFDKTIYKVSPEVMDRLANYPWPGNVKELKVLIEHVVMTTPGPEITINDLLMPWGNLQEAPFGELKDEVSGAASSKRPLIEISSAGKADIGVSPLYQKTLRGRVVMYGQGLHSGAKTGLTLSPLPCSAGILFGHITSVGTVHATLENVESTGFSTCLKHNGSPARTIEHLMAVFHAYGLTNVLVKISGEVPIMDGSAIEFCELVESAEIIVQDEPIEEVEITETFELPLPPSSEKSMRVEPSDRLEIVYNMDYPKPIGKMSMTYTFEGPEQFKREIAPARTFGFVRDMRMMDEMGLAGGGRLSNVVLLDDEKVINPPLRFSDEFVRHKILDIFGDFYLLGRPFRGKIIATQTGHTENIAMLKLIKERMGLS
jgi:UDP-3-O-acyl N-acetylglucosamine deacetylase